uniref:Glutamyl endopeptidase n=1 Tax=Anthurium amnicola TaxID=1678845 RepID=A0A1D1XFE0_9ARAE
MNKKIIFYFLIALVVLIFETDSIPTIPKYDENYWTSEKMKKAKLLTTKNIGFRTRSGVETIKNTSGSSKGMESVQPKYDANTRAPNVDQIRAFTVGMLFMSKNGEDFVCTASVINTGSGNIGLSAAHCLYDHNTQSYFDNVMFSPGFNNGQLGPVGKVPIAKMVVTNEFLNNNEDQFDWGMMLFNFNLGGHPLKDYTGALGFTFNVGDNTPTTFQGYPDGGNLQNCPNDGQTLCMWQGATTLEDDFYIVDDLNLGNGASGGPLILNYDPNTNLGILYSNYASFDELNDELLGPIYDPITFQALIGDLEL